MTESQIIDALRSLQRTIWQSVVTSVVSASTVAALTCMLINQLYVADVMRHVNNLHDRVDALSNNNPITIQQVGSPRTEQDNVLEVLKHRGFTDGTDHTK